MIEPFLKTHLEPVAERVRRFRSARDLSLCWGAGLLCALGLLFWFRGTGTLLAAGLLFAVVLSWSVIVWRRHRRWSPDYHSIVVEIERQNPNLHALLLTAAEQTPDPAAAAEGGGLNYLQQRVVRQALDENLRRPWIDTIPPIRLFAALAAKHCSFLALGVVLALLIFRTIEGGTGRDLLLSISVTPGDAAVERGSRVIVLARFPKFTPSEVTLLVTPEGGQLQRLPLSKSLDDPVFGGAIPEVQSNVLYQVEFDGQSSRAYQLSVFEYPRLEHADARIEYPQFTRLEPKEIKDTLRVSAVEGSKLDMSFHLNKPVAKAELVGRDQQILPLVLGTNEPVAILRGWPVASGARFELRLEDAEGRTNQILPVFVLNVLTNRAPDLKVVAPRGDVRVSPLEEMTFRAEAWDDFGLVRYGIGYSVGGNEPILIDASASRTNVSTSASASAGTNTNAAAITDRQKFEHMVALEPLDLEPGELISWHLWAEDLGPDGEVRMSTSDIYFAEVRPFEQIFRKGEAGQGQGEGQGAGEQDESTELLKLQKQVISATWNVRRQVTTPLRANHSKDVSVLQDSQSKALSAAEEMELNVRAADSKEALEVARNSMSAAIKHLEKASDSPAELIPALAEEQKAYQALLKLQAREFEVSRSRGQGGGGGGERNQAELDQLELDPDENRYETRSQAVSQKNEDKRERLKALSQLRDLAQRQQDLNERLKEIQAALAQTKSEEEREAIRRQLKRLREEERQLLADVDQLQERMNQPENQSRMAESNQPLERARSDLERASEALDREAVGQALSAATRAQETLKNLRDEFRKENSNQFADEMREMRSEARELAETQQDINKDLDGVGGQSRRSLSTSSQYGGLADRLEQQKEKLSEVLKEATRLSKESEVSEPLLSRQLYDALRKTHQEKISDTLGDSSKLLRNSFLPQAVELSQNADRGIQELKTGIEQAAESVLGDEVEGLRLAQEELEQLSKQLSDEIARQQGGSTGQQRPGEENQPRAGAGTGSDEPPAEGARERAARLQGDRAENGQSGQEGEQARDGQAQGNRNNGPRGAQQPPRSGQAQAGTEEGASPENADPGSGNPAQANSPGGGQAGGRDGRDTAGNPPSGNEPASAPGQGAQQAGNGGQRRYGANFMNRGGASDGGGSGPMVGEEYTTWTERLGMVEEMLDTPEYRADIARIRDRARAMRAEFKRHSRPPQWDLVQTEIATPLAELRSRLREELLRHSAKDATVPLDRDPVPLKYSDLVRKYYEQLGAGQ